MVVKEFRNIVNGKNRGNIVELFIMVIINMTLFVVDFFFVRLKKSKLKMQGKT